MRDRADRALLQERLAVSRRRARVEDQLALDRPPNQRGVWSSASTSKMTSNAGRLGIARIVAIAVGGDQASPLASGIVRQWSSGFLLRPQVLPAKRPRGDALPFETLDLRPVDG